MLIAKVDFGLSWQIVFQICENNTYIMIFHLFDHPVNYLAGVLEPSHRYFCVVQPVSKCFKSAMKYINVVEVFIHFVLER